MTFPHPHFLQLYPTTRCNQSCSFCFNGPSCLPRDMSAENALNLLDIMLSHGIADLDIMGGEPFLLPWMPSFIHTAVKEGIMVNISTNGSFPEAMEEFRELSPGKVTIGVSLEGSSAQTHHNLTNAAYYERALSSVRSLVTMGLDPIVKTVVNRTTMPDIPLIAELLVELGVRRYYLIHMDMLTDACSSQRSAISYHDFIDFYYAVSSRRNGDLNFYKVHASCFERQSLPEGVRCAGGVRKLCVMPSGAVYPCNLFQNVPDFSLGNIFNDTFSDLWSSSKLDYFRTFRGNGCGKPTCPHHAVCTGGCPAHAVLHNRGLQGTDIRCQERTIP